MSHDDASAMATTTMAEQHQQLPHESDVSCAVGTRQQQQHPPPPPNPSSDPRLGDTQAASNNDGNQHDIFKLPAGEALRLLSSSVELLVRLTGDVPPTPPPQTQTDPHLSGMQAEKESIARSHSDVDLAAKKDQHSPAPATESQPREKTGSGTEQQPASTAKVGMNSVQAYNAAMAAQLMAMQNKSSSLSPKPLAASQSIDGVQLREESSLSMGTASTGTSQPTPYIIIGDDSQPVNQQHGAITRKFYSKREPPIPIGQYLLRLHQFCPMSTAVYLATSLYIHRLAVEERTIPVTRRNAHRLVLAGLRVAMKALEDKSYPHKKIARVGGVSEAELARLEISFCFLAGFDLIVGEEPLQRHWEALRQGRAEQVLGGLGGLTLKMSKRPRETTREVAAETG